VTGADCKAGVTSSSQITVFPAVIVFGEQTIEEIALAGDEKEFAF
jgi:hypothetical protein